MNKSTEESHLSSSLLSSPALLEALIRSSSCYAGIGSRNAPSSALILISQIAAVLARQGLLLRSGGSPGADTAFEKGADSAYGKKEVFLPWKGFNGHSSPYFTPSLQAEVAASFCHPNWRACSAPARLLHARNCQQVYGENMSSAADFVLFWAPEERGIVKGGMATAVTLARTMEIPTFNLSDDATLEQWQAAIALFQKRPFWKCTF